MEREEAREGLHFASPSERDNPAQLFRAAEVHLSRLDEADLVVIGVGAMSGADQGWFWVVRSTRKDPNIILFAGGNSLALMDGRTNGYRDIRCVWSSPSETISTIYHFDGKEYKVWKKQQRQNPY